MNTEVTHGQTTEAKGVLVLGLGNVILGDDGLGAAALMQLERSWRVPTDVHLQEGGTLGLALLGLLSEVEHLIIVDAVRADGPPGTLVRCTGNDVIDAVRDRLSPHQVGVADLLDAARLIGCYPASVTLLGLVPESIELSVMRSDAVNGRLQELVEAIVREVHSLGYKIYPQARDAVRDRPVGDLAHYFGM